jgi:hypothetical protein
MVRNSPMVLAAFIAMLSASPSAGIKQLIKLKGSSTGEAKARQKDHRRKHRELLAAVSGDCQCLNWKDVFTQRGGRCGQGYEHFLPRSGNGTGAHLKTGLFQELWEGELCDRVFARLDTDGCLQQNMGEVGNSAQAGWCYVNATCSSDRLDLHRVSASGGSSLGLRMCVPGADRFLYEKSPQELQKFASDQGIDMGHLVKLTYPTMREPWERVSSFFTMNKSLHTSEISFRLKHTAERGNTVVWSSRNGLPPFGVTQGLNAWEVGFRPRARRAVMSDPTSVQVWAQVTKFRCVSGCSGGELADDAPVVKLYERTDVFSLGAPWARGRGMVQMRRNKRRGERPKLIQVQT